MYCIKNVLLRGGLCKGDWSATRGRLSRSSLQKVEGTDGGVSFEQAAPALLNSLSGAAAQIPTSRRADGQQRKWEKITRGPCLGGEDHRKKQE